MRADRLLSILLLLQHHGRLTAGHLATRLEVSERTIYRDIEALSMAGVPVYTERGQGGGCVLREPYRTNLTGISEAEARTLVVSLPARLLTDLGLGGVAETALVKLIAALPAVARRNAEIARERIYVDSATWTQTEEPVPWLPTVQEAVWAERKLALSYERADGTVVERCVDPLGIVSKGGIWYLVAAINGDFRSFRVSRMHTAVITDERCVRPEGFDLAAHWRESLVSFREQLPRYPVVLRVAPEILPMTRIAGTYAKLGEPEEPDAEGWRRLPIVFGTEDDACAYVFRFGTRVEVCEPPALRARVRRVAQEMAAHYAADATAVPAG